MAVFRRIRDGLFGQSFAPPAKSGIVYRNIWSIHHFPMHFETELSRRDHSTDDVTCRLIKIYPDTPIRDLSCDTKSADGVEEILLSIEFEEDVSAILVGEELHVSELGTWD